MYKKKKKTPGPRGRDTSNDSTASAPRAPRPPYLTAKGWKAGKALGMSALSCMKSSAGLDKAGVPVTQIARAAGRARHEVVTSVGF